jgi:hypothetical protein
LLIFSQKTGGQAMRKNIFIFFKILWQNEEFFSFRYREEKTITARKGVRI